MPWVGGGPREEAGANRPRVLHVITRLTVGGASENTIASIEALHAAGYDVTLAAGLAESDTTTVESARARGCRVVDVPSFSREIHPRRDLRALGELRALIASARPAIVHTHTSKAGFIGRLAARMARVPAIIHQPHGHVFYGYWGRGRTGFYIALERLAARWSDRIVTLTERGIEEHLARGIGRRAQYAWVPSGVPTAEIRKAAPDRAVARAALRLDMGSFVVVGVGRLVPIKGFDVLVASLRYLRGRAASAQVVLVGDGPEREALMRAAAAVDAADRLRITGVTSDVVPYLAAADVLAAPSRNEGMGRAIVEAMALGIPAIGTTVGGIPEVIGEGGRLVPPDDAAALAGALVELANDVTLRVELGDEAMRRAERFSTATATRRLLEVYASLPVTASSGADEGARVNRNAP